MTAPPDDRLGVPLVAALAAAPDPAVRAGLRWGLARWRVVEQDLLPRYAVVFAEVGRLSSPVCAWVAVSREAGGRSVVLSGAPTALGQLVADEGLRVDGVDGVRRVAAGLLEWARPLDGSVGVADPSRPRCRRVLACRGAARGLEGLERLARLTRGTEAEREATVAVVNHPGGELPARALSPDEALRRAAWAPEARPERDAALDGFVVFERGRLRPGASPVAVTPPARAPLGEPSPLDPAPWDAEWARWDALAPALAEWVTSGGDGVLASWNGYRGRVITLLEVRDGPVFVEVRVERDARTRVRLLAVG